MAKIRVTKQFNFEMAHALWNHDGPCSNLHGHSYRLFVTVVGDSAEDISNPKNGMVIDFSDLKKIVNEAVINEFDHAVVISREVPEDAYKNMGQMLGKLKVMDYQPTCENIITDFARLIGQRLPGSLELFSLRLHETATSYTEWFASDNPKSE
ncbi:MAG: 6-carboxytetrahydropterin synthase [Bacteroidales bacterium]